MVKPSRLRPQLCAAFCLIAATALPATALALGGASLSLDQGVYKKGKKKPMYGPTLPVKGPIITVYAESGPTYSHVADKQGKLFFLTKYSASCTGNREGDAVEVKIAGTTASDSSLNDKFETGQIGVNVLYSKLQGIDPIEWCNDQVTTLSLKHDVSKVAIVKQGFTMKVEDRVTANGTLFCDGKGLTRGDVDGDDAKLDLWIRCARNEDADRRRPKAGTGTSKGGQTDPGKASTIFKDAELAGPSGPVRGKCPMPLKYTASITADGPGTIEYQFIGDDDYESPVRQMKFTKASTQTSSWTRMARVPTSDTLAFATGDEKTADITGWMALRVIYKLKNNMAYTKKTWISPKSEFAVDCVTEPPRKPDRAKRSR